MYRLNSKKYCPVSTLNRKSNVLCNCIILYRCICTRPYFGLPKDIVYAMPLGLSLKPAHIVKGLQIHDAIANPFQENIANNIQYEFNNDFALSSG